MVIVRVEEQVGLQLLAENKAAVFCGKPVAIKLTVFDLPERRVAVIAVEIESPWTTVPEEGSADKEKLNALVLCDLLIVLANIAVVVPMVISPKMPMPKIIPNIIKKIFMFFHKLKI